MQTCMIKHDLKWINTQYVDLDLNLKLFLKKGYLDAPCWIWGSGGLEVFQFEIPFMWAFRYNFFS